MVSEKIFKGFPFISLWKIWIPRPGWVSLVPSGLISRICVGDHYTFLHTIKLWASCFQKSFPVVLKSMETLDPAAGAVWTIGASLAGFMKGTTRYC